MATLGSAFCLGSTLVEQRGDWLLGVQPHTRGGLVTRTASFLAALARIVKAHDAGRVRRR